MTRHNLKTWPVYFDAMASGLIELANKDAECNTHDADTAAAA